MKNLVALGLTIAVSVLARSAVWADSDSSNLVVATRENVFSIPFSIDSSISDESAGPKEVLLYVSGNSGRQWALYQRQPVEAGRFNFRAGRDGHYWFAVRTAAVGRDLSTPATWEPSLKVAVDTIQPRLELWAEARTPDAISLSWRASDANLDPSTFRIDYVADSQVEWNPVSIKPQMDKNSVGSMTWRPQVNVKRIQFRAEVHDRAGNITIVTRTVERDGVGQVASKETGPLVPIQPSGLDNAPAPNQSGAPPIQPGAPVRDLPLPLNLPQVPWPSEQTAEKPAPHGDSFQGWRVTSSRRPTNTAEQKASTSEHESPALRARTQFTSDRTSGATNRFATLGSSSGHQIDQPVRQELPPGETPRISQSRRFELQYELEQLDARSVARVELWYTTDGGATWRHFGDDADRKSPFEVQLDNEGTYGFRLIVHTTAGLSARPPQPGERADVWVLADWTRPQASLQSARYGTAEHLGKLIIRWDVIDRHLSPRPILLAFGPRSTGPWTTIASGLANTGQYAWQVSDQVPRHFFLRLQVRDRAGNVATDVLTRSISVDGLAPQGRIRHIRPLPSGSLDRGEKSASAKNGLHLDEASFEPL